MGYQDGRRVRTAAEAATSTAGVTTLEGQRVRKASLTVGFADLTDSDGAQTIPFAAALPADAVIVAVGLDVTAGFTDGVAGVFTADLGINGGDIDAFLDGADIASIDDVSSPQGVRPSGRVGAITPALTVLADVNVDTATAGSVVVEIFYVDASTLN